MHSPILTGSLLSNAVPVLIGLTFVYSYFTKKHKRDIGEHFILIAIAIYIGYMLMSVFIHLAIRLHFFNTAYFWPLIQGLFFFNLLILSRIVFKGIAASKKRAQSPTEKAKFHTTNLASSNSKSWILNSLFVISVVYWLTSLMPIIIEITARPITAWDAVWHWALIAHSQMELIMSGSSQIADSRGHPMIIPMLLTWLAYGESPESPHASVLAPWLLIGVANSFLVTGMLAKITKSKMIALFGLFITSSSPLVQTHMVMGGYAELWLSSAALSAIALSVLKTDKEYQNHKTNFAICIIALSASTIKNEGIVLSALLLLAFIVSTLSRKLRLWFVALGLTCVCMSLIYIPLNGLEINFFNYKIMFVPGESLTLGSRWSQLASVKLADIAGNFIRAYGVNASYYALLSSGLLALFLLLPKILVRDHSDMLVPILFMFMYFLFLAVSQYFSAYFYTASLLDTGLSRASLILSYLSALTILSISKKHSKVTRQT